MIQASKFVSCSDPILHEFSPSLLMMASKYCIPLLATICEHSIVSNHLESGNAISILQFADNHGSTAMQLKVLKFIQCHFDAISRQAEYLDLISDSQKSEILERIENIPKAHNGGNVVGLQGIATRSKFTLSCCMM